jgi:hypothetical protein
LHRIAIVGSASIIEAVLPPVEKESPAMGSIKLAVLDKE